MIGAVSLPQAAVRTALTCPDSVMTAQVYSDATTNTARPAVLFAPKAGTGRGVSAAPDLPSLPQPHEKTVPAGPTANVVQRPVAIALTGKPAIWPAARPAHA